MTDTPFDRLVHGEPDDIAAEALAGGASPELASVLADRARDPEQLDPLRTVAFNIPAMLLGDENAAIEATIAAMTEAANIESELDTAKRIIAVLVLQQGGQVFIEPEDVIELPADDQLVFVHEYDPATQRASIRITYTAKESTPA
ncbi:MAG: hypothetical protein AB7T06_40105 [Kofleriaceae bacterium]